VKSAFDVLSGLYQAAGDNDYIGEPVSQLQHALEAAALAQSACDDEELILAALLHDVGHLCFPDASSMGQVGVLDHEGLGADYLLSLGFSHRMVNLVGGHVSAKRYLVTTTPGYQQKLSEASQTTLGYQGGLMSAQEVAAFEAHPDRGAMLQLRAWDEAAKSGKSVPNFSHYSNMIVRLSGERRLTAEQLESFSRDGYLHLENQIPDVTTSRLSEIVFELERWPETPGKWMKYFEGGSKGKRLLCRIENFLDYESTLDALVNGPWMIGLISQLMAEPAVLFKEKINFKLPGAGGFAPHQDAPAFTSFGHDYHITLMLSFDASTPENGCLEVAKGSWKKQNLEMNPDKTLSDGIVADLNWQNVPTRAGDILLFGSYIPHRSGVNQTKSPRRALYATYNPRAGGVVRERYFTEKRRVFPPDVERVPGKDYGDSGIFNVGNPVATGEKSCEL
jgi:predicted HD phosphohydrolase